MRGNGRRPARLLRAVAVAGGLALSACGGGEEPDPAREGMAVDPEAAMDTTPAGTPAPPSPEVLREDQEGEVTARLAEWRIELSRDTVGAGEVTFQVMNTGTMPHALEVEGQGVEEATENVPAGATAALTVTLGPGTYEVYCPVESAGVVHAARGMRTTLTVVPAG